MHRARTVRLPFGEVGVLRGKPIGVVGRFGIGAPAAVFVLEWLAAMGASTFIAAGYAGGLHERQRAGDLVVCSSALRDEGTSYHYLPPADYSSPDPDLTAALQEALAANGYAHDLGPTWTTDAPFRETLAEIEHFREQGILTVEMEAAALFAASEHLGTACAAAFTISDAPRNGRWGTDFDGSALKAGLENLGEAAVAVLSI
jgi:uridine phosphorylase